MITTQITHERLADFTQPRNGDANYMDLSDFAHGSPSASVEHLLDHTRTLDTMRGLVEDQAASCSTTGGWGSVADEEAWI